MDDLQYIMNKTEVRYEDLVADPSAVLEQITGFLKISPLPAELTEKEFRIHKVEGKIIDQNKKSFERLSDADRNIIKEIGGELLEKLGYEIL